MANGWIGVDLDGTLAYYDTWRGADHIGVPIPRMLERVKGWLADGNDIRIFTARVWHDGSHQRVQESLVARQAIYDWCEKYIGVVLPVTNVKDYDMIYLYDDRAKQVEKNTGILLEERIA